MAQLTTSLYCDRNKTKHALIREINSRPQLIFHPSDSLVRMQTTSSRKFNREKEVGNEVVVTLLRLPPLGRL